MEKDKSGKKFITKQFLRQTLCKGPQVRQKKPYSDRLSGFGCTADFPAESANFFILADFDVFYIDLYVFGPSESTGDIYFIISRLSHSSRGLIPLKVGLVFKNYGIISYYYLIISF